MRKFFLLASVIVLFLSSCSQKFDYERIDLDDVSQSYLDYLSTKAKQSVTKEFFEIKFLRLSKISKGTYSYYFYDFVVAPKTTFSFKSFSVNIEPDYDVNSKLNAYFTDEKGMKWLSYDLRPNTITKHAYDNITYSLFNDEKFNTLRFQGYLSDGGEESLLSNQLSKEIIDQSILQMKITLNCDSISEIFQFSLSTFDENVLFKNVPNELYNNNHSIKAFVDGGLSISYVVFHGNQEEIK